MSQARSAFFVRSINCIRDTTFYLDITSPYFQYEPCVSGLDIASYICPPEFFKSNTYCAMSDGVAPKNAVQLADTNTRKHSQTSDGRVRSSYRRRHTLHAGINLRR
jgi:hypothetical protein